jgi:hypothetical protein
MELILTVAPESLGDLLCTVLQAIEDNKPTVEEKCFYSEVCALTTDDAVRINAARVQSILEHHVNPLDSKQFTNALISIGDALTDSGTPVEEIEYIFVTYIGMGTDEFLGEYGETPKITAPEPLFLQAIIDLTENQTALTAAANVQYVMDKAGEDFDAEDYPASLEGLAVIIKNSGLGRLRQLELIFANHLNIDVVEFIYDYPQLFETDSRLGGIH